MNIIVQHIANLKKTASKGLQKSTPNLPGLLKQQIDI